jgi:hypothetical protein
MSRADKAVATFKKGFNCTQAVLSAFGEEYGLDPLVALRVAAAFGGAMGVDKDILGCYTVGFLSGTGKEVLQHPGIPFNSSAGTRALLLFCQERVQSALPAGGGVGEVGNRNDHGSISFL